MFNKTILAVATTALLSGLSFTAMAADNRARGRSRSPVKLSVRLALSPGDENQTIELGEVADGVLNSGKTRCRLT